MSIITPIHYMSAIRGIKGSNISTERYKPIPNHLDEVYSTTGTLGTPSGATYLTVDGLRYIRVPRLLVRYNHQTVGSKGNSRQKKKGGIVCQNHLFKGRLVL